jgi:histidinol-phosphate/aromatic aminotransferase/cobyric acid decarboxylase-like protein
MKRASPIISRREHPGVPPDTLVELGLAVSDVLDLSTGVNPYGPPVHVLEAARRAVLTHYPDPTASAARSCIAERFATTPDAVVVGNGAAELLWSCARVLLFPGATLLAVEPGYPEFSVAARQLGARVVRWRSVERTGHRVDLAQVAQLIELENPDVVSLCAPGSPTGSSVTFAELEPFAASFPKIRFVVDQSFLSLSDDHADLFRLPSANVLCVRSLGKELGLPGVRSGYLLASVELAARVEATRPAFSTSAPAQAMAEAAMAEGAFVSDCRARLQADRTRLIALLDQLGLAHTPSVAPFCLVRMDRASEVARELLAGHRVAVHDATQYGLPDHLRISAVSAEHAPQLTAALLECTKRRGLVAGREA